MSFPELGYNPDPERERRNKALRCAIIKGYDWEARNESWYNGIAEYFPGIILPTSPRVRSGTFPRQRHPRRPGRPEAPARTMAGPPKNLPTLVYGGPTGTTERLFFEQFRAWMQEIGFPREKDRAEDLCQLWRSVAGLEAQRAAAGLQGLGARLSGRREHAAAVLWPERLTRIQRCQLAAMPNTTASTSRRR